MTKEELEKEAKKFLGGWLIDPEIVKLLVDFAEPREKKIESLGRRCLQLQKDKGELIDKTRELERKIASIRGSHRVDVKKLNARIEQVERLKKENAELKDGIALKDEEVGCIETDFNTFKSKAKEIIKNLLILKNDHYGNTKMEWRVKVTEQAEQFLKEEQNVFNQ